MEFGAVVFWGLLAALLAAAFFAGAFWEKKRVMKEMEEQAEESDSEESSDSESEEEDEEPDYSLKMVLCVRKDLPMTKGKVCAQCCHAAVGAVNRARRQTKDLYKAWQRSGCKKVALQCPDEAAYMEICAEAQKAGLTYYAVCDAGRTQLEPNTFTVVALGPDREERIDKITGREGSHPLKLL
ncbi:uncharacterized protein [Blastocystis hominis]|uniref:peptidyl-tRNA hydrolase n=1 Tax=Blastocystis hominis TaxID=12968 RepID=D8MBC0_BLAHO|nr:uncharacterized protein [Blastocystis hominis]CBK25359.2 unnamed protein product [Blastocystis hominis]|eukprot:XP_012899407.1 uncharacterized protein [Blastocystis hominis]